MKHELASKFKLKNLVFMVKCVFHAAPILFPLMILITIALNVLSIWGVYIMRDAINEVARLVSGVDVLEIVLFLITLYIIVQLIATNILRLIHDTASSFYYKNADRFFRTILLYKLGKIEQEKMYDSEFYNKYEFTYTYLYMFQQLPWHLMSLLVNFAFTKIAYLIIVFTFNIWVGVYCSVFFLANIILTQIVTKKRARIDQDLIVPDRRKGDYANLISEKDYIKETKVNKLENFFFRKYREHYLDGRDKRYKNDRSIGFASEVTSFVGFISRNALLVFLLYLVFKGEIDVGDWVLLRAASGILIHAGYEITRPTKYLVQFTSYSPVMIDLLYPLTRKERKEMKKFAYEHFTLKLGEFKDLELRNVTYRYPAKAEEVVKEVNLKIEKGEIISILGYNGSGKTTLCKLLCGILPCSSGEVLFNGQNINQFTLAEYYRYFGIGFQDYAKYNLTLRENIGFGRVEEINNEIIIQDAISKTNMGNILERLPKGIDTYLGKAYDKNGQDLSGGQWQRIILARAYMGNPEILVLDEPTASIDPFEEERMLEHFSEILNGKTAILISHRISFARLAKKIVMMKDGMIVEVGTHEELVKRRGFYYELFHAQQQLYNEEVTLDG